MGQLGHADEGMAGNIDCLSEAFRRAVEQSALQIVLRRESDGVNQNVEPAPLCRDRLEQRFELAGLADVERHEDRCFQGLRQRFDVRFRFFVEVGDRQFRFQFAECFGAAVGDGMLVGDAGDQCLLALKRRMRNVESHDVMLLGNRI